MQLLKDFFITIMRIKGLYFDSYTMIFKVATYLLASGTFLIIAGFIEWGIVFSIISGFIFISEIFFKRYKKNIERKREILSCNLVEIIYMILSNYMIHFYQRDTLEKLYTILLNTDFSFSDNNIEVLAKNLGKELEELDDMMAIVMRPLNDTTFHILHNQRTLQPTSDIMSKCKTILSIFYQLNKEFDTFETKWFNKFLKTFL